MRKYARLVRRKLPEPAREAWEESKADIIIQLSAVLLFFIMVIYEQLNALFQ